MSKWIINAPNGNHVLLSVPGMGDQRLIHGQIIDNDKIASAFPSICIKLTNEYDTSGPSKLTEVPKPIKVPEAPKPEPLYEIPEPPKPEPEQKPLYEVPEEEFMTINHDVDYHQFTKKELVEKAKQQGKSIPFYLKKDKIIDILKQG